MKYKSIFFVGCTLILTGCTSAKTEPNIESKRTDSEYVTSIPESKEESQTMNSIEGDQSSEVAFYTKEMKEVSVADYDFVIPDFFNEYPSDNPELVVFNEFREILETNNVVEIEDSPVSFIVMVGKKSDESDKFQLFVIVVNNTEKAIDSIELNVGVDTFGINGDAILNDSFTIPSSYTGGIPSKSMMPVYFNMSEVHFSGDKTTFVGEELTDANVKISDVVIRYQ